MPPIILEDTALQDGENAHERFVQSLRSQMATIEISVREEAKQLGVDLTEEALVLRLIDNAQYLRLFMYDEFYQCWGKQVMEWPNAAFVQNLINRKNIHTLLEDHEVREFSISDQKAMVNADIYETLTEFLSALSFKIPWNERRDGRREWSKGFVPIRCHAARDWLYRGSTWAQRYIFPFIVLLWKIMSPIISLFTLTILVIYRVCLQIGLRAPILRITHRGVSGSISGTESLAPAENGYTKAFRGGDVISLDELENELMKRNEQDSQYRKESDVVIICISYKHFANQGIIPGDDHRICRTDLQAIAQLIREAEKGWIRFWIDTKLPPTTDGTFERWLDRGVRPYGRYITLICPSAQQYAESSFWLSNEYHFSVASKGILHFKGNEIYFKTQFGYQLELNRRFLHVVIQAERQPVHVREEDIGKVIHWALCCLRAGQRNPGSQLSPSIDNMTMVGEFDHRMTLMLNISNVIRKFGPQVLPVILGKSWNKRNPLLLDDVPDQDFDLSTWYGMALDETPETVYVVQYHNFYEVEYETVVALEVVLEKPHYTPGKNRVMRKVLRGLETRVLIRCKFVVLPWLCDWE